LKLACSVLQVHRVSDVFAELAGTAAMWAVATRNCFHFELADLQWPFIYGNVSIPTLTCSLAVSIYMEVFRSGNLLAAPCNFTVAVATRKCFLFNRKMQIGSGRLYTEVFYLESCLRRLVTSQWQLPPGSFTLVVCFVCVLGHWAACLGSLSALCYWAAFPGSLSAPFYWAAFLGSLSAPCY